MAFMGDGRFALSRSIMDALRRGLQVIRFQLLSTQGKLTLWPFHDVGHGSAAVKRQSYRRRIMLPAVHDAFAVTVKEPLEVIVGL